MQHNRAQSGVRALFVILAIFLILYFAIVLVMMPLLENLLPVISGRTAVQNAGWLDTGFFGDLRLIGYIGVPVTILGMMIAWVFVWYVRKQSSVG